MYDPNNSSAPQGWVCPNCKLVHAPWSPSCNCMQTKKEEVPPYTFKTDRYMPNFPSFPPSQVDPGIYSTITEPYDPITCGKITTTFLQETDSGGINYE